MRDRYVRRVCAGLILAIPILIHLASPSSSSGATTIGSARRFPIGPILASEGFLAVGLALAWRARRSLELTPQAAGPAASPSLPARVAGPLIG